MQYICSVLVDPQSKHQTLDLMSPDFPYQAQICDLHYYPDNLFPWHWHREIEIFYIREGELDYHLPGGTVRFEEGQGGFLNSNVLHMTTCKHEKPCIQEEQQFSPEFIGGSAGSRIMQKYVLPILDAPGLELVKLDPTVPDHRPLLDCLCHGFALYDAQPEGFELELQRCMLDFWQGLCQITASMQKSGATPVNDQRIKQMLSYIADHYGEKLQLEDIAAAAYLSPRACGRCFQTQLGTTPFAYLLDYRIQRACDLLASTDQPVGEIAARCGFSSSSYFGRIFRDKTGQSPNEYRKRR